MALGTYPYRSDVDSETKVFGGVVGVLTTGQYIVIPASGMSALMVIAGAGATAVVSRVDSIAATAATGDSEDTLATVTAHTATASAVDWPFYLISVTGGSCRYALT